jgi:group I intron endonuclease
MIVYLVTNAVNGKKYIGQTKQDFHRYWSHCCSRARAGSFAKPALYAAIRKYGVSNFSIKILVIVATKEDADYYERELIKAFGTRSREKGYNCTDGGEGLFGYRHSEETKRKMSLAALGNKNGVGHRVSDSQKAKLRGNKYAQGHRWTEAEKKRISLSLIGNKRAVKNKG